MPTIIKAKPGESAGSLIRRFKKQVVQDQIMVTVQDKRYYKSPSMKKKEKKKELERRKRKEQWFQKS